MRGAFPVGREEVRPTYSPSPKHLMFDYPLPLPQSTLYDLISIGPESSDEDLREASTEWQSRTTHEAERLRKQGDDKGEAKLRKDLNRLGAAGLDKPADRAAYDARHPPLALLKLPPPVDPLKDTIAVLARVRQGVSKFLFEKGVAVPHPSDFTRTDFRGDFHAHAILDGDPS